MDDDVDTDDEIFKNAKRSCNRDNQDMVEELQTKGWRGIVNNIHIAERVSYPD
jgi:hypothetical protein